MILLRARTHINTHTHIDKDTTLMNVNEEDLKRAYNTLLIWEEEWRLRYVFRAVLKHPFPCTKWVALSFFYSSHRFTVLSPFSANTFKSLFSKYSFYAIYPLTCMLRTFNFVFPNAYELDIRAENILSFSLLLHDYIYLHAKIHTIHTYTYVNTHPIFISKTHLYYFPS